MLMIQLASATWANRQPAIQIRGHGSRTPNEEIAEAAVKAEDRAANKS